MGEVATRSSIRPHRAGLEYERLPQIGRAELWLLRVLVFLGGYSLLFFGDYWFLSDSRRSPWLFVPLSFAVFWKPLRSAYNWWLYLWTRSPVAPKPSPGEVSGTVDVVTTAMPGEPFAMFQQTLTAIALIEGLGRAFLLDGGNDPLLKTLCGALGITHVDCREVKGAKAGKVNYCLQHYSRSDYVIVIDPDHVPRPDFIRRVLPYFSDPKVGFVQVVQAYYNLRDNWVAWAAAEQTFGFYGPTLMGLDGLGLPTAIGANCTFRRKALDAIGGHAVHLAEDALTSMRLHAAGWSSVYLPFRASLGLVPSDLSSFWKQQLKWATGMTQLMVREYPRLFPRFSPVARLHYGMASTYYLGGVATALNLLLPPMFLFFQGYAIELPVVGFVLHLFPYLLISSVINFLVQRWYSHYEEWGVPWRSMLLEHGSWHIYLLGFFYGISGRPVPYLPTPKGGGQRAAVRFLVPLWVVIVASFLAVGWSFWLYPCLEGGTALMMLFASLNGLLLLPVAWEGSRGWFPSSLRRGLP